jgi:hypothetical protein
MNDRQCTLCGQRGHRAHSCPRGTRCTKDCAHGQGRQCTCQRPMTAPELSRLVLVIVAPWAVVLLLAYWGRA